MKADPDARLIMGVLMSSPNRDDPGALLAAAKAYEAVRSAIPPLDEDPYRTPITSGMEPAPDGTGRLSPERARVLDARLRELARARGQAERELRGGTTR